MKKVYNIILILSLALGLSACGSESIAKEKEIDNGNINIVTTNSIIADMVENVVKDKGNVYSIVPIGVDPHDYEPLPMDMEEVSNSDIVFFNGLNLETGGGWFIKLMETTNKEKNKDYFVVSEGVKPMYLTGEGKENEEDPHAWLDLQKGIKYVENITKIVSMKDEENSEYYENNSKEYIKKLEELDREGKEKFKDIDEDKKLLVSSEGAFKYFSKAYDLTAVYIWEINTESQGTPDQMSNLIDTIRNWNVPVVFVETSVDPRSMEQISAETGLPIYETIFTDSLAKKGEIGDSYYDMVKWNLDKIYEGLSD